MKELIGTIPKEKGFIKPFRFHQGWWRTFVMAEEEGQYWDEKNKKQSRVCNRINNGDKSLKNFLSTDIAQTVSQSVEINKVSKSGVIDEERLYNNLLSSQPLAFNFFGYFKRNLELALNFIKTIRPDITKVEDVVFEFAPSSTKDKSAFDFGFIVWSDNRKGFMGFECKYTDTFSYKRPKTKLYYGDDGDKNFEHYFPLYENNRIRFTCDYFNYIRNKHYNQLFRNELLGIQLTNEFDFITTGLFCHHDDTETVKSGMEFKKMIGNGTDDFIMLTYADYFEKIQRLNLTWEQRELVMMIWARYCGLGLSNSFLSLNP